MQVIHTNKSFFKVALTLFPSLLFLFSSDTTSALTYQSSTNVEFTLNPTISITLSDPNLIIDNLTPGSSNDSNIITVNISTNAGYGYYMSATAGTSTGNTDLTNQSSPSAKFTNLSSNVATLSSFPDNNWGYSYSIDNGTTWISGSEGNTSTGYNGLPLDNDDSGATGIILSSTDSFTNTGSIKFKIGAKASTTQASGTYTNTVNFYAVANPEPQLGPESCDPGKICYHVNSLAQTEGTMGKQNSNENGYDIVDGGTTSLLASNFSRTGYGFAGWSDTYDYTGNLYGPQETITIPAGTTANGLSLYAIWVKSEGSIQDSAKVSQICDSLTAATPSIAKTLNSVSALTDQRDNNTYAIAKLADGKCWMIENLRLNNTAEHNSDGTLAQGYSTSSTYGNFVGLANSESSSFSSAGAANSIYSITQSDDAMVIIGTTGGPASRMPRYNNINTAERAINPTYNAFVNNASGGMFSYGNYYSWAAAMANTNYYDNPTSKDANGKTSETANTSICPTGWRLPYGNNTGNGTIAGGFYNLNFKVNNDSNITDATASLKLKAYPNNFIYSGYYIEGSARERGTRGDYWSSTADYDESGYPMSITSGRVLPGTAYGHRSNGLSIRCVNDSQP